MPNLSIYIYIFLMAIKVCSLLKCAISFESQMKFSFEFNFFFHFHRLINSNLVQNILNQYSALNIATMSRHIQKKLK